jgi:hypothetical protein
MTVRAGKQVGAFDHILGETLHSMAAKRRRTDRQSPGCLRLCGCDHAAKISGVTGSSTQVWPQIMAIFLSAVEGQIGQSRGTCIVLGPLDDVFGLSSLLLCFRLSGNQTGKDGHDRCHERGARAARA